MGHDFYVCLLTDKAAYTQSSFTGTGFDVEMGRIDKGVNCSVVGCSDKAIRSISSEDASQAKLNTGDAKRAYLCKTHYKELKKRLRKDRRLQKWRWNP